MTVDDEDPREALPEQRIDDVREDCDQGGLQERGAARVRGEAGHTVWEHRQHREPRAAAGGPNRRTLGKDVVGLEREVGMLLGRADGEHDPVVSAQVCLELHPVEVADPHREARTLTPKPNPRLPAVVAGRPLDRLSLRGRQPADRPGVRRCKPDTLQTSGRLPHLVARLETDRLRARQEAGDREPKQPSRTPRLAKARENRRWLGLGKRRFPVVRERSAMAQEAGQIDCTALWLLRATTLRGKRLLNGCV